jgi:type IV secretion system protein VirB9
MKEQAMLRFVRFVCLMSVSTLCLSACSAFSRPETYQEANLVSETPPPVRTVTVVQPLPLPGQLQKAPTLVPAAVKLPKQRVEAANRSALEEPASDNYVNAIQVYPYSEGALYRLYAAPQQVSDIALQPGENLTAISAGDTTRWVVGDTTSGTGSNRVVHILTKPFAANLHTNLVITTDRRTYHLQLESTPKTYMAAVSWNYPQESLLTRTHIQSAPAAAATVPDWSVDKLRFDYTISGDGPPWRPIRAFDDGTHVYIQFPKVVDKDEAPPLFIAEGGNKTSLVNYRMRGCYYIVDRLFGAAELRLGQDHQVVVRIKRNSDLKTADAAPVPEHAPR